MSDQWTVFDQYVEDLLLPSDPVLTAAIEASVAAGLPPIQVSPTQGKFLQLLVQSVRARSVLEIGTLGGYSTLWLGRGVPSSGRVLSLEVNPLHADIARRNLARAGLSGRVEILVGPALETLPQLAAQGRGPFDLTFVNADKPTTAAYFDWAVRLSHPGSVIVVDNVVRNGAVVQEEGTDADAQGIRRFLSGLKSDTRVSATVLQTVGRKGYDGFALAFVL